VLAGLTPERQREVLSSARRRRFRRGDIVFHEGDPGDTMHLIERGRVAVRITTPHGDTATIRILRTGEHFGELVVLSEGPRNATVVALEPTETLSLGKSEIDRLRREYADVDRAFLETIVRELRRLSLALVDAMYTPAPTRLVRTLVTLAETYGTDNEEVVHIPLTQDDLAGLCGTTRPTVSQMLGRLVELGLVRVGRGRVEIVDLGGLRKRTA
jgi:CRP-like cAMP-binding protein